MTAYYYRVRNTGSDTEADPTRPDLPSSYGGGWAAARSGDWWLVMTEAEISVDDGRGSVIPIPDLPTEASGMGLPFESVRDHWGIGGLHHPERQVA